MDGDFFNAAHIENFALRSFGAGTSQYEYHDDIEPGDNWFYEKVANCEGGGGLEAIVYNNVNENCSSGLTTVAKARAETP